MRIVDSRLTSKHRELSQPNDFASTIQRSNQIKDQPGEGQCETVIPFETLSMSFPHNISTSRRTICSWLWNIRTYSITATLSSLRKNAHLVTGNKVMVHKGQATSVHVITSSRQLGNSNRTANTLQPDSTPSLPHRTFLHHPPTC